MRAGQIVRRSLFLFLLALVFAGCAINPATGRRQLVLVSEQQEIAIGMQNDQALVNQLGLYPDEELQAYVQRLGADIASRSERPNLEWKFRVVDDPVVNAFALPGGFIYITRGILAHFNNESELGSVIGHEIGHVTARHGVSQMTKQQLAQIGMLGGMILAPEQMQQFGDLAQQALGLAFLKFSRDDERQADDLGLRYLISGGYDPRPMPEVFETLRRVSEAAGGERLPGWMSTHPLPENRSERIHEQIDASGRDFTGLPVRREEYFRRIDNIVFGEDPQQGYFKDNLFMHPQMQFQLQFPEGWKGINQRSAVVAISPEQDAIVQLSLAGEPSAAAAHEKFFSQEGVIRTHYAVRMSGGLPAAGSGFSAESQQGTIQGLAAFVEHNSQVFQMLAYTPQTKWTTHGRNLENAVTSFDRLQDRRAVDARPQRLKVVRLTQSMSFDEFSRRYESSVEPEMLALLNGVEPGSRLQAGQSYKIVTGGYTP